MLHLRPCFTSKELIWFPSSPSLRLSGTSVHDAAVLDDVSMCVCVCVWPSFHRRTKKRHRVTRLPHMKPISLSLSVSLSVPACLGMFTFLFSFSFSSSFFHNRLPLKTYVLYQLHLSLSVFTAGQRRLSLSL